MKEKELIIGACMCGGPFAKKVVDVLRRKDYPDLRLLDTLEQKFSNTEIKTVINRSIRDSDFFLIQDCETREFGYSTNDSIMAMKTALDAAYQSHVARSTLFTLSYPYARQDKNDAREGITASKLAQELEMCYDIDTMLYMDIHNPAISGFFKKALPVRLSAVRNLVNYVQDTLTDASLVIFADAGGSKRSEDFAAYLNLDLTGFQKKRDRITGSLTDTRLIGNVDGHNCLIYEDMIDTAGTLSKTCEKLKEAGAKKIYCVATHGLFNGSALDRLDSAYENGTIDRIVCTDSVYHDETFKEKHPWYDEVSVASYVAKVIHRLHIGDSVSALLD